MEVNAVQKFANTKKKLNSCFTIRERPTKFGCQKLIPWKISWSLTTGFIRLLLHLIFKIYEKILIINWTSILNYKSMKYSTGDFQKISFIFISFIYITYLYFFQRKWRSNCRINDFHGLQEWILWRIQFAQLWYCSWGETFSLF